MVNNPATGDSYVPTTSAPVYLPRTGNHVYNGTAWVNEGLLLESEQRINLHTYSEDFTQWSLGRSTVSANAATSPDGNTTATKVIANTVSGAHYIRKLGSFASQVVTHSAFVKAGEYSGAFITVGDTVAGAVTFDLVTQAISNLTSGFTASISDVGDGWFRISLTGSATSTNWLGLIGIGTTSSGSNSFTGDGTSGIYIWGAQLEAGSTPSSYIPNAGATAGVTRAAETLTVAAADMPWPTVVVTGSTIASGDAASDDTNSTGNWFKRISGGTDPQATTAVEITSQSAVKNTGTYALKFDFDGSATVSGFVDLNDFSPVAGTTYKLKFSAKVEGTPDLRISVDDSNAMNFNADVRVLSTTSTSGWTDYETVIVASSMRYFMVRSKRIGATTTVYLDGMTLEPVDPLSVSIQMDGRMTYADTDSFTEVTDFRWQADSNNSIQGYLSTYGTATGQPTWLSKAAGVHDYSLGSTTYYSPGINVPFNSSSRHGSTFINGAVDGTALTANTTPTALPDLSAADFNIAPTFMGNLGKLRVWADDLTDTGIAEATLPSTEPSLSLTFDGSETSFTVLDWSE
jgi:hypothetical protein